MTLPTEGARQVEFTIAAADAGQRLDVTLALHVQGVSRSVVQRWIRDGLVAVDGKPAKASTLVEAGKRITAAIPASPPTHLIAEPLPIRIVYEDDSLAVIDKPAGMVVHPSAGHHRGTVVNALLHHISDLSAAGGAGRPGIVHRLDKGTSGLMVIAKTDAAHRDLARQFHDRRVLKEYVALVWGRPARGLTFSTPLGRDPRNRQKISSRAPRGRPALTTIVASHPLGEVSLVRLTIGSGRTHQIRVHLSEAGYPVVGDDLYGGDRSRLTAKLSALARLTRPFLHAVHLEFLHPSDRRALSFDAPLPEDLTRVLSSLGYRATDSPTH